MEQSRSQDFSCTLLKPKCHYYAEIQQQVPTRHLMNVLHIPKPYFCKVSLNIIIASTPGSSFQGFQYKNFHAFFIATTCPAHLIPCDMITVIIFCED